MIDPTRAKNNFIFFFSKIKKEKIFKTSKGKKPDEENLKRKNKMEIETTEPPIRTDSLDELRAMHEAHLDYCEAQDCCWEDSYE
jgi:hypothetical protein